MRIIFRSKLARSKGYRADIDGLRAIAVLPVVFYHAKLPGFRGGYVGVDIFYVISGYLITSVIAKDLAAERFSFVSFYERRIRRIFPAIFSLLFVCSGVAVILLAPRDLWTFGKSLVAMTFFATNVLFAREQRTSGYFAPASARQVLLHTWSLSVEEQFYLFFPALLVLLTRWTKKQTAKVIFLIAAASFAISLWAVQHRPIEAFYIFIPRGWELLIGALLALRFVSPLTQRILREIAGIFGIGLIAWAVFAFSDATRFPGVYALAPCLGAWLIIYAGEGGASCVKSVLSFQPLVFVGVISYSLYLWHWPLLMFGSYFAAGNLSASGVEKWLIILGSGLIAFLSFEFIETPFRGSDSAFNRQQIFRFAAVVSLLSAAIGLALYASQGLPERYGPLTRQVVLKNTERKSDFDEVCANWQKKIRGISDIDFCTLGPDSSKKIMFWGDSHVQQLYPLLQDLYSEGNFHGQGVLMAVATGCLPSEHLNLAGEVQPNGGYKCNSFTHFAMQRAEESDVSTVFIGFAPWWFIEESNACMSTDDKCIESVSPKEAEEVFFPELTERISTLKRNGKRVILSLPFPIYDKSIPDLEIRNAIFGGIWLQHATDLISPALRKRVTSVATATGADVFDSRNSLCSQGDCLTQIDGVSIYTDSNHLAASEVGLLRDDLVRVLQSSAGAVPVPPGASSKLLQ